MNAHQPVTLPRSYARLESLQKSLHSVSVRIAMEIQNHFDGARESKRSPRSQQHTFFSISLNHPCKVTTHCERGNEEEGR